MTDKNNKTADMALMLDILKKLQADVSELKEMRHEMREGFASIKSHMTGLVGDVFSHERRLLNVEDELTRLKNRIDPQDKQQ